MLYLREPGSRLASDPLSGRVGSGELGIGLFELLQFAVEVIVGGVGDLRLVEDVIQVVVVADPLSQLLDPSTR